MKLRQKGHSGGFLLTLHRRVAQPMHRRCAQPYFWRVCGKASTKLPASPNLACISMPWGVLLVEGVEALDEVAAEGAQRRLLVDLAEADRAVDAQAVLAAVDRDVQLGFQADAAVLVVAQLRLKPCPTNQQAPRS